MTSLVSHTREWLGQLSKHKITLSLVGHWFCNFDGFLWMEMTMVPKRDSISGTQTSKKIGRAHV